MLTTRDEDKAMGLGEGDVDDWRSRWCGVGVREGGVLATQDEDNGGGIRGRGVGAGSFFFF